MGSSVNKHTKLSTESDSRQTELRAILHELGQPLTAVRCFGLSALNQIEDATLDLAELRATIDKLVCASNLAVGILSRYRDSAATSSLRRHPVNIGGIVEQALALLSHNLSKKQISIVRRVENAVVSADPIQIQEVLINLLRNSIDAIPVYGQIEIGVTNEQGEIKVTVADNGSGIEMDLFDRLFYPLDSEKNNGMGLGLALSRTIIESHGGRIWFCPNQPTGARFHFVLPVVEMGSKL